MNTPSSRQLLTGLFQQAGHPLTSADDLLITGQDPILPTPYPLGTAAAAVLAAVGLAAAELWRLRSGRRQRVAVDLRAAAIALRSHSYLRVDGQLPPDPWDPLSGFYRTSDGRWLQLHTNYLHHRAGTVGLLKCAEERGAVAEAVAGWTGPALETALAEAGLCAAWVRTRQEWLAEPQGQAVAGLPLFEIVKIGDSPPEPLPPSDRPLAGVRVLELTHVIAGPVGGRTLAEHGAEVLYLSGPHRPSIPALVMDTGRGKRAAQLDLRRPAGAGRLRALVGEADIFLQSYRPGALARLGFGPEELAELRPGLIYASLSAYGHAGPWCDRRGYDSLVQSASGIVVEESGDGPPRHLPAQALDYLSGYLLAFGAMVALARRTQEGGSYLVRLSLAQTGHWLDSLGRCTGALPPLPEIEAIPDLLITSETPFGHLRHLAPVVHLAETPASWARPAVPLGWDEPAWLV